MQLSPAKVLLAAAAPPLGYSLIEPHLLQVREFEVHLPDLPKKAEGWTVVQISDVHLSAIGGARLLQKAVEISNSLQPDLVALTGDYVSRRNSYSPLTLAGLWAKPIMDYAHDAVAILASLRSRLGIFAVAGNHDHANGRCDAMEKVLSQAGIISLRNSSVLLEEALPLAGLDDLRGGRPLAKSTFAEINPLKPHLILSHNPRMMLALRGRNALVLTGHTHGGQVHLPFTRFRVRPRDVAQTPFLRGWYQQPPLQMYVNSGLGSVHFPMRFRCPPEIAVFRLRNQ